jgi:hypothetical protein
MCQNAGLLYAIDYSKSVVLLARGNCECWACAECAEMMTQQWRVRARLGAHEMIERGRTPSFVTITSHEKLKTFEQCNHVWGKAWSSLYAHLKRKSPEMMYLLIPEKHQDGRMHVHAIWDNPITQKDLKKAARARGLGHQCKVISIGDESTAIQTAMSYVTKYVGKSIGQDYPLRFKRVRVSANWTKLPIAESSTSSLNWDYISTNNQLQRLYMMSEIERLSLIDAKTGEIFDDVDLCNIDKSVK